MMLLGLFLGAACAAIIGLRPAALGLPYPNLNGELAVRPTFARVAAYMAGRWLGSCLLGAAAGWLGSLAPFLLAQRLAFAGASLLAFFMFLFLAAEHSPDMALARATDASRLRLSPFGFGLLSSGTLLSPMLIALLFAFLQRSPFAGAVFFTNYFLGTALVMLPHLLNMSWVKHPLYGWLLRGMVFFCALSVLFLGTVWLIKS